MPYYNKPYYSGKRVVTLFFAATGAYLLCGGAIAHAQNNPWDYEEGIVVPERQETVARPATSVRQRSAKSWTEMDYVELLEELEHADGLYSPYTKKQMWSRLRTLTPEVREETNVLGRDVEEVVPSASAAGPVQVMETGGAPVFIVPAAPQIAPTTTPWWKLPKSQQAAAKTAQEQQIRQQNKAVNQATGVEAGTQEQPQEKKESARGRIYQKIQQNRGY